MTPSLEAWLNLDRAMTRELLRMADEAEASKERVAANIDSVHLRLPIVEDIPS